MEVAEESPTEVERWESSEKAVGVTEGGADDEVGENKAEAVDGMIGTEAAGDKVAVCAGEALGGAGGVGRGD